LEEGAIRKDTKNDYVFSKYNGKRISNVRFRSRHKACASYQWGTQETLEGKKTTTGIPRPKGRSSDADFIPNSGISPFRGKILNGREFVHLPAVGLKATANRNETMAEA